jgi:hypothetical protein
VARGLASRQYKAYGLKGKGARGTKVCLPRAARGLCNTTINRN